MAMSCDLEVQDESHDPAGSLPMEEFVFSEADEAESSDDADVSHDSRADLEDMYSFNDFAISAALHRGECMRDLSERIQAALEVAVLRRIRSAAITREPSDHVLLDDECQSCGAQRDVSGLMTPPSQENIPTDHDALSSDTSSELMARVNVALSGAQQRRRMSALRKQQLASSIRPADDVCVRATGQRELPPRWRGSNSSQEIEIAKAMSAARQRHRRSVARAQVEQDCIWSGHEDAWGQQLTTAMGEWSKPMDVHSDSSCFGYDADVQRLECSGAMCYVTAYAEAYAEDTCTLWPYALQAGGGSIAHAAVYGAA